MTANMKKNVKGRADFLFEIGCEEIPAGMIVKACAELKALLEKYFTANALLEEKSATASIETFGAPRRLTAIVRNVQLKQEDVVKGIIGPPKAIAFDAVGEPTRAAIIGRVRKLATRVAAAWLEQQSENSLGVAAPTSAAGHEAQVRA
jgi:glycyl-tRNA synthetase beta subunit